jgi:uncharacterized protein
VHAWSSLYPKRQLIEKTLRKQEPRHSTLYRVIAIMLVLMAIVLIMGHDATVGSTLLTGAAQAAAGAVAGFIIGVVASLLGVAGGELLTRRWVLHWC